MTKTPTVDRAAVAPSGGSDDLAFFYLKIPPANIAQFKFLIESYDGLGIVRTLNRLSGEVVVLAPRDTASTVDALLTSIKNELELQILPAPEAENEDWLLAE
jgi:hypothetical protein